jgi:GNAT superfamily N-acetyltransferase
LTPVWTIRRGGPGDHVTLIGVARSAIDTYSDFTPGWSRPKAFDEANEAGMTRLLPRADFLCLIAEADGDAVAHVTVGPARRRGEAQTPIPGLAHLGQLFVLREWWGSGVAKELLDAAMEHARQEGYERIRLFTPRDHARARRFYEREGWRPTGEGRYAGELELEIVEYARAL